MGTTYSKGTIGSRVQGSGSTVQGLRLIGF